MLQQKYQITYRLITQITKIKNTPLLIFLRKHPGRFCIPPGFREPQVGNHCPRATTITMYDTKHRIHMCRRNSLRTYGKLSSDLILLTVGRTSLAVECSALLLCIQKVPASNLDPGTGYPD
jgi:hypothetical protein